MCIDEIISQISNLQSPMSNEEEYILFPNPNYTPVTDTLPDGTLVAYDAVTDMWSTRDMRIYRKTSNYGHFGRELEEFTWEKTNKVDELRAACGLA